MILTILAIVLVFGIIVFIHELGHMLAAKSVGVAVPDFAIGMGPSLASFEWGGTRYHICPFPIGGFVRVAGMEGDAADAPGLKDTGERFPVERTWQGKNGWQKAWILTAGPLMNVLLAFVLMMSIGLIGFPTNAVMIGEVEDGYPAAAAGMQAGDLVLAANGQDVGSSRELVSVIQHHEGDPVELEIIRGGEEMTLTAIPMRLPGAYSNKPSLGVSITDVLYSTTQVGVVQPKSRGQQIGLRPGQRVTHVNGEPVSNGWEVYLALAAFNDEFKAIDAEGNLLGEGEGEAVTLTIEGPDGVREETLPGDTTPINFGAQFKPKLQKLPAMASLTRSLEDAAGMMMAFLYGMKVIFSSEGLKTVSGPVGIMDIIGQSARAGWYTFLQIVILININLGLLNLLPLPALDGGRLVFVGLAGIGLKVPEKREAMVHMVGMVMLLGLIALITFTDIAAYF